MRRAHSANAINAPASVIHTAKRTSNPNSLSRRYPPAAARKNSAILQTIFFQRIRGRMRTLLYPLLRGSPGSSNSCAAIPFRLDNWLSSNSILFNPAPFHSEASAQRWVIFQDRASGTDVSSPRRPAFQGGTTMDGSGPAAQFQFAGNLTERRHQFSRTKISI